MVDSMSSLSCSEITRNPFDSGIEGRTNCPDFSPSMFSIQETPGSQKKRRSFRWSIGQISRLNPADIEEFPDQEYSTTFEREEDEIAAQEKIDEYFSQNFIVPSPWTPNHEAKHVKFSPLPPATAYIEALSSVESSYSSPMSSNSKAKADASSQTKLSLPPDFDLQNRIDAAYYNKDGLNGSKDTSLSSLRRKLFTPTDTKTAVEKDQLTVPTNIKSILKSPKSPAFVTSSPVSDQSTPRHAVRQRHSTASTLSSPNMSPIKPLPTVQETPTSARRGYLSRQSLSPMDCSSGVLESSGIDIKGDILPDLSPIKAIGQAGKSVNDKEDPNNSVDDGGPLEVSALSTKEDNEEEDLEKKEEHINDYDDDDDEDDEDEEMPPKITMEDLADDLDSTDDEKITDQSTDSPELKFTESSPRVISDPGEIEAEVLDAKGNEKDSSSVESGGAEVEKIDQESEFDKHGQDSRPTRDFQSRQHASTTNRSAQAMDYSSTDHYHKSIHLNELDEDVIIMRAKVALRRANRLSPPKGVSNFSFDPQSLTLSDLSLNGSTVWDPVRMSTPLVTESGMSTTYRSYTRDNDSHHGYKSYSRSRRYKGGGVAYTDESGIGRSEGEMPLYNSHGISGKRLSPAPVVEHIIQGRKQHGDFERHYPLSYSRKKPSSPLFSSQNYKKWQLSQTHPMSYVEWKALYWRPPKDVYWWRNDYRFHTDQYGYDTDVNRSSWPPRPVSSKLIYGSRPLSPPVTFPPAKVPRAVPGGFVSKIALPSYQDSDSGYSEWSRSISQRENFLKSQRSSSGFAGDFHYYY